MMIYFDKIPGIILSCLKQQKSHRQTMKNPDN